jgi:predicted PurR-regulated permease PerM
MVKLINNTNSILDYVQECLNNLLGEYKNNKELNSSYSSFTVFESDTFNKMEEAYFHYVVPVIQKMSEIIITALNNFVKKEYNIAICVIAVFIFIVLFFYFYVYLIFIKQLEYSIKVSKNIFRIIPSNIISSNQDLENWLESINNES